MIVLVNRYLFRRRFVGLAFWPFIFIANPKLKGDLVFLNHERIHLRQQLELLIIFFYVWYGIEFLCRWISIGNWYKAYRNISFEREAYKNEKDLQYCKKRSFCAFLAFC
ncbi:hypothetical protein MG296_01355 [Flavobacteriaceae bacterium TK19130]|nr:hypothetical protein [Thermobacterium salinum]